MSFHLAAWTQSVDQPAIAPIAAVSDQVLTISGNNVQIPPMTPNLVGAFGIGVNLTRMQLQSPTLRGFINFEVAPLSYQATPLNPPPFIDLMATPIPLAVAEQMQCATAEDGAGATRMSGFVLLGDGKNPAVTGEIFSIRATAAATLTAYTWTNTAIVLDQVLPVGNYAIVGARFWSAGLLAFRFVFQGQIARPGAIGQIDNLKFVAPGQRMGYWGEWGEFNSTAQPTMDFFSSSADTSETGVIDLVQLPS